jgi:hypothetical protein
MCGSWRGRHGIKQTLILRFIAILKITNLELSEKKLSLAPALVAIVDAQLPGQQHTPERLLTHLFASYQVIIKFREEKRI